jgi:hypothetical protein
VIASRGLRVDGVERGEIVPGSQGRHDFGLLGLADIAAPLLVEPCPHVVEGATGQGELEDVARLYVAEARTRRRFLPPSVGAQILDDSGTWTGVPGCEDLTEAARPLRVRRIRERGLDGLVIPAA